MKHEDGYIAHPPSVNMHQAQRKHKIFFNQSYL